MHISHIFFFSRSQNNTHFKKKTHKKKKNEMSHLRRLGLSVSPSHLACPSVLRTAANDEKVKCCGTRGVNLRDRKSKQDGGLWPPPRARVAPAVLAVLVVLRGVNDAGAGANLSRFLNKMSVLDLNKIFPCFFFFDTNYLFSEWFSLIMFFAFSFSVS